MPPTAPHLDDGGQGLCWALYAKPEGIEVFLAPASAPTKCRVQQPPAAALLQMQVCLNLDDHMISYEFMEPTTASEFVLQTGQNIRTRTVFLAARWPSLPDTLPLFTSKLLNSQFPIFSVYIPSSCGACPPLLWTRTAPLCKCILNIRSIIYVLMETEWKQSAHLPPRYKKPSDTEKNSS